MRLLTVSEKEAGQRLSRLLEKYMDRAPAGFCYKMLRKKNITLNGKKAAGNERVAAGDEIRLFLAEATIDGFSSRANLPAGEETAAAAKARPGAVGQSQAHVLPTTQNFPPSLRPEIVYEDSQAILFSKPAGLLSQKAKSGDRSLVDYLIAYLLESGQLRPEELRTFRPGICNRLDRNTSGLVAAGKTLRGLQEFNVLFRERELHKYYRSIAAGTIAEKRRVEGWLMKDGHTNQVHVYPRREQAPADALPICTEYLPLRQLTYFGQPYTYLEINLLTGRAHQIRAHLASLGHPLIGDAKYGDAKANAAFRQAFGLPYQLLHAYRLELPELTGALISLSGQTFTAPLPAQFERILQAGER